MNSRYHIFLTLLTGALLTSACLAEDNWNVEGEHGELHVSGVFLEGACHLAMRSAYQEIVLEDIPRGALRHPGDSGQPVTFSLQLLYCQRTGGTNIERTTLTATSSDVQPVVSLNFTSVADADSPSLLKMQGISGVGLMIRDNSGRQIVPGEWSKPQIISLGDNQLTYTVTPVRTVAPLVTGKFRTVVDFKVSYD